MDTSTLIWGMIFGAVGLGMFTYGKQQKTFMPLFSGIALMVMPYFVFNVYLLVALGVALVVLPFLIKI
ncbi:MAG: hypothetical protein GXP32_05280 [Kiritimatiellaeota bacterium]|nr:hypothetical protein [Kiritimatiellota bacterium]